MPRRIYKHLALLLILLLMSNISFFSGVKTVLAATPSLSILETTIHPGDLITLRATGFTPNMELHSLIFGSPMIYPPRYDHNTPIVTFNASGSATFSITVPANLYPEDNYVTIWAGFTAGNEDTAKATFTVTTSSSTAPSITSCTPTSGPSGTTVNLSGSHFGTKIGSVYFSQFPSVKVTPSAWSDTSVTAAIPTNTTAGTLSIWLDNGTELSNKVSFTVISSPPVQPSISQISPTSGVENTTVTISGRGFTGTTAVNFGTHPAKSFQVISDTQITAVSPSGTSGSKVDITITNPIGASPASAADLFSYSAPEASLAIQVTDPAGSPLQDVLVSVSVLHNNLNLSYGGYTDSSGALTQIPHLAIGDSVQITAEATEKQMYTDASTTMTLAGDKNSVVMKLGALPMATLSGQVTNNVKTPVAGAVVSISQTYVGRSYSFSGTTDSQGKYNIRTIAVANTSVQASPQPTDLNYQSSLSVTVDLSSGQASQDLALQYSGPPLAGKLSISLFTAYLGSSEQQVTLDWRTAVHLGLTVTNELGSHVIEPYNFDNSMLISSYPGKTITVAFNNAHSIGLPDQSQTVTVDQNGNATANIHLVQVIGVQGSVTDSSGTPLNEFIGSLFSIDSAGKRTWLYDFANQMDAGNQINLGLTQAGTYLIQAKWGSLVGTSSEFTVAIGQSKDIGVIKLNPVGYFTGQDGNGIDAQPSTVIPGGTVTFTIHYANQGSGPAKQAELLLEIPLGTSLAEKSVIWNGHMVSPSQKASGYSVALGDVASGASGILSYQVQLDSGFDRAQLLDSVQINFLDVNSQSLTETIGSTAVTVEAFTFLAPTQLSVNTTTASGQAPAGSTVTVYDGNVLLGAAVAASNGFWKIPITLADKGSPSYHALTAKAKPLSGSSISKQATLYYNNSAAQLTNIELYQNYTGIGHYSFDPRKGTARFPVVYVPGSAVDIQLTFDKPQNVYDVIIYFANVGQVTAHLGSDNLYHAQLIPGYNVVPGDMYVGYKTRTSLDEFSNMTPPTLEQVRNQVIPKMQDFVVGPKTKDPSSGSTALTITLPAFNNEKIQTTTTVGSVVNYNPTAADRAMFKATGVPIYGFTRNITTDANGNTRALINYYVPKDMNSAQTALLGFPPMVPVSQVVGFTKELGAALWENTRNANFWTTYTNANSGAGALQGTDVWAKYQALLKYFSDHVQDLTTDQYNQYKARLDAIESRIASEQALGAAVDIAGTVNAPETLGGSLLLNGMSWGAGKINAQEQNNELDSIFYAMGSDIDNHFKQNIDQKMQNLERQQQEMKAQLDYLLGNRNRNPVYNGVYKIDPSGYVYEGLPQNRLSGVSALIMVQDSKNNWVTWNAMDYEDTNPKTTDSQGRYGWDVPAGYYRVVFSKDGYHTTQSDAVPVPPAQTEVNAGLISLSGPAVKAVTSAPGGASVDVSFTQYVQSSSFTTTSRITISDSNGQTLTGTLLPINPVLDPKGVPLVLAARFTATTPLKAGGNYTVSVSQAVQNYAGRSMTAAYTGTFTVPLIAPPPIVSGISPSYGPKAGGTSVLITGSGFKGVSAVTFGTALASGITIDSDSQIRVTAPAGSGLVNVTVTNSTGTSAVNSSAQFYYQTAATPASPMITSLSTTSGSQAGGTQVVLTGSGFTGTSAVNFGSLPATSFSVNSDTSITTVSPIGANSVPVTVTTPVGTSAPRAAIFTYIASSDSSSGSGGGTYSVSVSLDKEWRISFSQPVASDQSLIESNISLWRLDPVTRTKVKADITPVIDPANSKVIIVKHAAPFLAGTSYELSVNVGIKDVAGKSLSTPRGLSFMTQAR